MPREKIERVEPLFPRFEGQLLKSKPHNMSALKCSTEERIFLEKQALSIFTECCNSGLPLRDCLVAVLVSGMDWGIQSQRKAV